VGTSVDRRPGKRGEIASQKYRSRLSCLTNSLSDDLLKKGGENHSEYEKASLEGILTITVYSKPKDRLFQAISSENTSPK
jgi:hypothetical protein